MGWDLKTLPPHVVDLMNPSDQERLGLEKHASTAPDPELEIHPEPILESSEGEQQNQFADWLAFRKAEGKRLVVVWHRMDKRSTASKGTSDFIVGVNGVTLYIEFKRSYKFKLSPAQEEFRLDCEANNLIYRVVYSANAAISLVREHMNLSDIL